MPLFPLGFLSVSNWLEKKTVLPSHRCFLHEFQEEEPVATIEANGENSGKTSPSIDWSSNLGTSESLLQVVLEWVLGYLNTFQKKGIWSTRGKSHMLQKRAWNIDLC